MFHLERGVGQLWLCAVLSKRGMLLVKTLFQPFKGCYWQIHLKRLTKTLAASDKSTFRSFRSYLYTYFDQSSWPFRQVYVFNFNNNSTCSLQQIKVQLLKSVHAASDISTFSFGGCLLWNVVMTFGGSHADYMAKWDLKL